MNTPHTLLLKDFIKNILVLGNDEDISTEISKISDSLVQLETILNLEKIEKNFKKEFELEFPISASISIDLNDPDTMCVFCSFNEDSGEDPDNISEIENYFNECLNITLEQKILKKLNLKQTNFEFTLNISPQDMSLNDIKQNLVTKEIFALFLKEKIANEIDSQKSTDFKSKPKI